MIHFDTRFHRCNAHYIIPLVVLYHYLFLTTEILPRLPLLSDCTVTKKKTECEVILYGGKYCQGYLFCLIVLSQKKDWMWGNIVWRYILPRLPLLSDCTVTKKKDWMWGNIVWTYILPRLPLLSDCTVTKLEAQVSLYRSPDINKSS